MRRKKKQPDDDSLPLFAAPAEPLVLSVSAVSREIKLALEELFADVWVEGEISGFKVSTVGHVYFRLKDAEAVLDCVIWKSRLKAGWKALKDGMQIQAYGGIDVYPPRGSYQLVVRDLRFAGVGALQKRFEELKRKLAAEGLFAEERKRPIPLLAQRIGVVSAPGGAALQDFLRVARSRCPDLAVRLYPCRVQGVEAPPEIVEGIRYFNASGWADVIVVTRGGGSLEDLWAFNEEAVARAIFQSRLPVISAVGHEVDFSISDFVADLRLPTPTAAAVYLAQQRLDVRHELRELEVELVRTVEDQLADWRAELRTEHRALWQASPQARVQVLRQRLDELLARALQQLQHTLHLRRQEIRQRSDQLPQLTRWHLRQLGSQVQMAAKQLEALDPRQVLQRGFSITYEQSSGRLVTAAEQVPPGTTLLTQLKRGQVVSEVKEQ